MGRIRRWLTKSPRTTRKRSLTSVMMPSSGFMPTSWPRLRSSRRSRRRLRPSSTRSSPSCTRVQEVQVCQTWEVCQEGECQVQEELLQEEDLVPDQLSRKLIKFCPFLTLLKVLLK